MPELPEVETVVLGLSDLVIGHKILEVEIDYPKTFLITKHQLQDQLLNSTIQSVSRRGKSILIHLDNNYSLLIHLKMTGQLVYIQRDDNQIKKRYGAGHPSDSLINKLPDSTTRVIFYLDDNATLFFNDMRKFGWVKLVRNSLIESELYIQNLGPDALTVKTDQFIKIIAKRQKSIKACLLDQTLIAGCGNIYADESLWLSRIAPYKKANELSNEQLRSLLKALKQVLQASIEQGGSSSRNYINAKGEKGNYLDDAYVYQKAGQACQRCGDLIQRIVIAGRGTHICEVCQSHD